MLQKYVKIIAFTIPIEKLNVHFKKIKKFGFFPKMAILGIPSKMRLKNMNKRAFCIKFICHLSLLDPIILMG
jgi:hypothetical protein